MSNRQICGKIHSIETFGAVDGPGIRYIIFVQGCALKCLYCHNPDSWDINSGKETSVGELLDNIASYRNFLSGGITISGGEPLLQPEFVYALIDEAKKIGYHTAIDTAGSVPLEVSKKIIDAADMLLLDIKALESKLCFEITGQDFTNKNELATLDYCESTQKPVWIRHVLVPGYTLSYELLENLAKKLSGYKCIKRVDLLPFHKMGEFKWHELNREYKLSDVMPPTTDEMTEAENIFRKYKLI